MLRVSQWQGDIEALRLLLGQLDVRPCDVRENISTITARSSACSWKYVDLFCSSGVAAPDINAAFLQVLISVVFGSAASNANT